MSQPDSGFTAARREMVDEQLVRRGIRDRAVLDAALDVPREEFVQPSLVELAYHDRPLPIGEDQTISQPYVVALMIEALELSVEDTALEIGTGSGYAAAMLAAIAREVYTVERYDSLARAAEERFRRLGLDSVRVRHGDGSLGWKEHAPYDAILVSAASPVVPAPLLEQLAVGGRLVIPRGPSARAQTLTRLRRTSADACSVERLGEVQFVPLIGHAAWRADDGLRGPGPGSASCE